MARMVTDPQEVLDKPNRGNFAKLNFLGLKPDESTGYIVKQIRLVGPTVKVVVHSNRIIDEADPEGNKTKQVPFVDAEFNHKPFARNCTENDPAYGPCPWCKKGYQSSKRFAVQVIDRDDGQIKILEKGTSVFEFFANIEKNARDANKKNNNKKRVENLGDFRSYDLEIRATKNAQNRYGGVDYTAAIVPDSTNELTDEEMEALRMIGNPQGEALDKLLEEMPFLADKHECWRIGYNLCQIYRPDLVRTGKNDTEDTLAISSAEDEEEAEAPAAATMKASLKASVKNAQEENSDETEAPENPFKSTGASASTKGAGGATAVAEKPAATAKGSKTFSTDW